VISKHRGDATVIFYASAFLQKTDYKVSIEREGINGFMNVLYGVNTNKGLVQGEGIQKIFFVVTAAHSTYIFSILIIVPVTDL